MRKRLPVSFRNVSSYLKSQESSETALSLDILPEGDAWNGYRSLSTKKEASGADKKVDRPGLWESPSLSRTTRLLFFVGGGG